MLNALNLTSIPVNVTPVQLEARIVTLAGAGKYNRIHFDETDSSWANFQASTAFHTGITYPASATANDSYVVTLPSGISAYTASQQYSFIADTNNTGACSVNFNGIGVKAITDAAGANLANATIKANFVVTVEYDGTNMVFIRIESKKDVATRAPLRFQSTTQGWVQIINSIKSLEQIYHATPFPKV